MKFQSIITAAFAALTLFSCSKESENGTIETTQEGKKTYMEISVLTPTSGKSRAHFEEGLTATAAESNINNVRLYVFNAAGLLERVEDFADHSSSKTFEITTGEKTFIAGANMAGHYPTATVGTTTIGDMRAALSAVITTITTLTTDNAFWMVSTKETQQTIVEAASEAEGEVLNHVEIEVGRVVAKIGVHFNAPESAQEGGVLSNVKYSIRNNPNKFYFVSSRDQQGYLVTPYYNTSYHAANYFNADTYYDTEAVSGIYTAGSITYMMENSHITPLKGNSTYILLRGTFTPGTVYDAAGANPTAGVTGNSFWRIYNTESGNFDPRYFAAEPDASLLSSNDTTVEYPDGTAYYHLYITDTEGNAPLLDKYTIERNTAWRIEITSVSGAGYAGEGGEPIVIDPALPVEADAFMQAEMIIADWVDREMSSGI